MPAHHLTAVFCPSMNQWMMTWDKTLAVFQAAGLIAHNQDSEADSVIAQSRETLPIIFACRFQNYTGHFSSSFGFQPPASKASRSIPMKRKPCEGASRAMF